MLYGHGLVGGKKFALDVPDDLVYLSAAPHVDQTHDCFFHSLTTCKGELASKAMRVRIADENGKVLVDETQTTFKNGLAGF